MKWWGIASVLLVLFPVIAGAQIGFTQASLDSRVGASNLVVRGAIQQVKQRAAKEDEQWLMSELTLNVEETIKGELPQRPLILVIPTLRGDERWSQFAESGQEQLWFLQWGARVEEPMEIDGQKAFEKGSQRSITGWSWIRLGEEVAAESDFGPTVTKMFTMQFRLLSSPQEILGETRRIVAQEPKQAAKAYAFDIPRMLADRTGLSGDANRFVVPGDRRLERLAQKLIDSPESTLPRPVAWRSVSSKELAEKETWRRFSFELLQGEGAKALVGFPSDENIERLEGLLDHPATIGTHGVEERRFYVREAAIEVLKKWGVEVPAVQLTTEG